MNTYIWEVPHVHYQRDLCSHIMGISAKKNICGQQQSFCIILHRDVPPTQPYLLALYTLPSHITCHYQMTSEQCLSSQVRLRFNLSYNDWHVRVWMTHSERFLPECLYHIQKKIRPNQSWCGGVSVGVTPYVRG